MPTLIDLTGFEHGQAPSGTAGVWDGGGATTAPTFVTSPVHSGLRAMRFNLTAQTGNRQRNIPAGNRVIVGSVYFRFAAFPSALTSLLELENASADFELEYNNATGKFAVSVGSTSADIGPVLSLDTWYLVDFRCVSSADPATMIGRVDGDAGTENTASRAQAAADITIVRHGSASARTIDVYEDDWAMSATSGDYPIGEHTIESLIPASDGSHNIGTSGNFDSFTTTAFDNTTTNGNTFLGHRPLQIANTANQLIRQDAQSATEYMEFLLENLSDNALTVAGVQSYATHVMSATTGTPTAEARLLLADNTEVLTTGSISVIDASQDPGTTLTVRKRMTIPPSGGWDGTKVDGLKVRVGFNDIAADVNFSDFMLEVCLLAPTSATLERAASLDATADITSAPQRDLHRVAAVSATADIAAGRFAIMQRSASLDATADIVSSGVRVVAEVERAASLDATADITVVARRDLVRAVALDATAQIAAAGQLEAYRAAALGAIADVAAGRLIEAQRSASLDATAQLAAAGTLEAHRTVSLDATAAIAAVGQRHLQRAASLDATAEIAASGELSGAAQRSASLDATATIETTAQRHLQRAASLDATAEIAAGRQAVMHRAAALDATADIATSGAVTGAFPRAVALDATAQLAAAGQLEALRAVALDATAGIATGRLIEAQRSVALDATASITTAGELQGAVERSVALSATADIEAAPQRLLLRSAALDATASVTTAGHTVHTAAVSLDATADVLIAALLIHQRTVALEAVAEIGVTFVRDHYRAASLDATADIEVQGEVEGQIERSVELLATAAISVAGEFYNPTEDWDLPPPTQEWLVTGDGEWLVGVGSEWPMPK